MSLVSQFVSVHVLYLDVCLVYTIYHVIKSDFTQGCLVLVSGDFSLVEVATVLLLYIKVRNHNGISFYTQYPRCWPIFA